MKPRLKKWCVYHQNRGVIAVRKDKRAAARIMEQLIADSIGQQLWLSVEPVYYW